MWPPPQPEQREDHDAALRAKASRPRLTAATERAAMAVLSTPHEHRAELAKDYHEPRLQHVKSDDIARKQGFFCDFEKSFCFLNG